jgi:glycosyltransferase involved in cell wall biosynthesis
VFPGFIYGDDSLRLMKHAYCYIQPSDVEGLSPVILNVMGIGTPIICSDIKQNIYAVSDTAILFKNGDVNSLRLALEESLNSYNHLKEMAENAKRRALSLFSWDHVTIEHVRVFHNYKHLSGGKELQKPPVISTGMEADAGALQTD